MRVSWSNGLDSSVHSHAVDERAAQPIAPADGFAARGASALGVPK